MPHSQVRYYTQVFLNKLKFQRVVLVQGVRQCGKSFFLRDLFAKSHKSYVYVTLDQPSEKKFAQDNPESFIQRLREFSPIIIDEAQKATELFDVVKYIVDKDQRRGQFVLSGSTEFSIKSNIHESLTGRASTLRLFPLTIAEALEIPQKDLRFLGGKPSKVSRVEFMRHLERGGMPGIFYVHSKAERRDLMRDWIELTVHRDLLQLPGPKKDSSLAMDILQKIAELDEPTVSEIARSLRVDRRKINSHVEGLKTLFAIHELQASEFGTGKPRLYLCDVGFAGHLGANFKRTLETLYLQELLAFHSFSQEPPFEKLRYYRTTKGSTVDFILHGPKHSIVCLKIHDRESINALDVRIMAGLQEKLPGKARFICAAGVSSNRTIAGVEVVPWEFIASV